MLTRLSLRNRFILSFVLIATILVPGSSLAARQIMVAAMQAGLDHAMARRAEMVSEAVLSHSRITPGEYEQLVDDLTENQLTDIPLLLRIAEPGGNILASFGEIPDSALPQLDQELASSSNPGERFESVRIRNTQAIRVYTVPVIDPGTGATVAVIQTANSLTTIQSAKVRLWWATAGIAVAGAALAGLLGFILVKRSLLPLERILGRVSEVETISASLRLPDERRPPELQNLADSLNDMWDRLQRAVDARDEFIATVSHDLRTPFTAIRGQVDVMLLNPGLSPEDRSSLERMRGEIARLIRLSNNLLLDVQLDHAPVFSREEVNIRELLEDVVMEMGALAQDREMRVHTQYDVFVRGDFDLLKQSFINIVDNAIKATPPGGRIDASALLDGEEAVIRVEDTGPGINEAVAASLDSPFKPVDRKSTAGGAGLGLSIVSKVMRSHGGKVVVSGRGDGAAGARVDLRMPLHSAIVSIGAGP